MKALAKKGQHVRLKVSLSLPEYVGKEGIIVQVYMRMVRTATPFCTISMDCDGKLIQAINTASWIEVVS